MSKPRQMVYKMTSQKIKPNPKRSQQALYLKVFLFDFNVLIYYLLLSIILFLVFGFIGVLIIYTLFFGILIGLSVYALSYYDKKAYGNVKAKVLPIWTSATANLDPQVAAKVNYYLQQGGTFFDVGVQNSIEASIKSYKLVKANPTVQQYAKNIQEGFQSLWDSVFKKVKST